MKKLSVAAIAASVTGMLVFVAAFVTCYIHLLAHQPPRIPVDQWTPLDVTGFPPSAAWVLAFVYGLIAFVVVFAVAWAATSRRP